MLKRIASSLVLLGALFATPGLALAAVGACCGDCPCGTSCPCGQNCPCCNKG